MQWIEPEYTKGRVDRAGSALVAAAPRPLPEEDLEIFANWRSSHAFPLNTFQNGLRAKATKVCAVAVVSQRLKRLPSAIQKLARLPTMKLSQMQDIGGCRAVVTTVGQVRKLHEAYLGPRTRHRFMNDKNYIDSPKMSGYRSLHLVYRYHSARKMTYNGHLIEIQLRTRRQHAWATAVETAGAFLGQALKSSEGEKDWLRFFALVSAAFALEEGCATVPGTPTEDEALRKEIQKYSRRLDAASRLKEYRDLIKVIAPLSSAKRLKFFLLERRPDLRKLTIRSYRPGQQLKIAREYLAAERDAGGIDGAEAVLVSADSIQAVQRAYPNYQLDTTYFLEQLRRVAG